MVTYHEISGHQPKISGHGPKINGHVPKISGRVSGRRKWPPAYQISGQVPQIVPSPILAPPPRPLPTFLFKLACPVLQCVIHCRSALPFIRQALFGRTEQESQPNSSPRAPLPRFMSLGKLRFVCRQKSELFCINLRTEFEKQLVVYIIVC